MSAIKWIAIYNSIRFTGLIAQHYMHRFCTNYAKLKLHEKKMCLCWQKWFNSYTEVLIQGCLASLFLRWPLRDCCQPPPCHLPRVLSALHDTKVPSPSLPESPSVSLSSACHLTSERDSHSLFTNYRSTSVTCRICAVLYINLLTRGSKQNNYFRQCWMAVPWLVILL